jgi:hypothetical protein
MCYIVCEVDTEVKETTEHETYNMIVFYVTYELRLKKNVNDEYKYNVATQR